MKRIFFVLVSCLINISLAQTIKLEIKSNAPFVNKEIKKYHSLVENSSDYKNLTRIAKIFLEPKDKLTFLVNINISKYDESQNKIYYSLVLNTDRLKIDTTWYYWDKIASYFCFFLSGLKLDTNGEWEEELKTRNFSLDDYFECGYSPFVNIIYHLSGGESLAFSYQLREYVENNYYYLFSGIYILENNQPYKLNATAKKNEFAVSSKEFKLLLKKYNK